VAWWALVVVVLSHHLGNEHFCYLRVLHPSSDGATFWSAAYN
jgi:hypothetical protein